MMRKRNIKVWVLAGVLSILVSHTAVLAGPADKVEIRNSTIKNKAVIKDSKFILRGKNQKLSVGNMNIRKGTRIKNSKIENKTVIKRVEVKASGSGQNIEMGNLEIGK
jgi:bifunctional N-acetylglucosamine-1-phosphate-uridyltransferase/glucosamine-1-phosphate-acetyltransferase GlmU-like protein